MSDLKEFEAQRALAALQSLIRSGSRDAGAFCELGPELERLGRPQEAKHCFRRAVEFLQEAARNGDADRALAIETRIYLAFVRPIETEQHYHRCFALWRDDLTRLGRRMRDERALAGRDATRVAFVLATGHRLGHTEVLVRYMRAYLRQPVRTLNPRVYVYGEFSQPFIDMSREAGFEPVLMLGEHPELQRHGQATWLTALRDQLRSERMGCAVWVSLPASVSFAFAMGLAPVQVLWSLRFHPVTSPYADGYITYGAPGERERVFGKQAWRVVPTPLAIEPSRPDPEAVRAIRARFPHPFLFGTIAREEKIRSPAFLKAVAAILQRRPEAGFLWTGHGEDAAVASFFAAHGVAERCHFVGWVDPAPYASAMDVFLETFPLGCGITGYQALGAATPLLSILGPNTVFGMRYWDHFNGAGSGPRETPDRKAPDLAQYPVLCAASAEDYVELACRLAADPAFRAETGRRGRAYFEQELDLENSSAAAFFGLIEETIAAKKGAFS
jgi:glycosyltransferase involved in cell wall biosynthesis